MYGLNRIYTAINKDNDIKTDTIEYLTIVPNVTDLTYCNSKSVLFIWYILSLSINIHSFSGEEQKKALETELKVLKDKLAPTESAVVEAANKLNKLQVFVIASILLS